MTVSGRRLPFAGIAKAIDCVTATKGWSRPITVIQARWRERRLWDRKAVVRLPLSVRQLIAISGQCDAVGWALFTYY